MRTRLTIALAQNNLASNGQNQTDNVAIPIFNSLPWLRDLPNQLRRPKTS